MSTLDMIGFETQSLTHDNITMHSGSAGIYDPSPLPVGSQSTRALRQSASIWSKPWPNTVSGTRYQFKVSTYYSSSNNNNDTMYVGVGTGSTEQITISAQDSTGLVTIRVNGAVVATAGSKAWSGGVFDNHWLVKVDQQTGGLIEVYASDDLVTPAVTYTLTAPDIATLASIPTGWYVKHKNTDSNSAVDDFFAVDPDNPVGVTDIFDYASFSIKPQVFTGAGNSQDWNGTFAEIDDIPFNDSDKISATAPNQKSDFSKDPIGEDQVLCVKMTTRTLRSGTDAGSNIRAYQREGGLELNESAQAAPGSGINEFIFQTARDGGAHDATKYDATTYGVESIT